MTWRRSGWSGPWSSCCGSGTVLGDAVNAPGLWGTSWRLEDLAGAGVTDRAQATLEFPKEGQVSGNGSCNQLRGAVTMTGAPIAFGPLPTTRKICSEAVMRRESRYLAALKEAERLELRGPFPYVFTAGPPQPLRFIDAGESGSR